ncbi:MAG: class I SAM-dependent methyltransferase [Myxococcota bacterium]
MSLLLLLDPLQVPIFETFVVPRYLSMFGALALDMLLPCEGAVVANLGSRTGYPDTDLSCYMPGCRIFGYDPAEEANELARTKATLLRDAVAEYGVVDEPPFPAADGSFSHVISLYPMVDPARRVELIAEATRLLVPGGQVLCALPLRGSYQEVADLLREYALKHDAGRVAKALEAHTTARPTIETFGEIFEACGLTDVDVDMRLTTLTFPSGREFLEDPVARLLVVPDMALSLGLGDLSEPMEYVRNAIDRYWSELDFELSVNVGCASARKPG